MTRNELVRTLAAMDVGSSLRLVVTTERRRLRARVVRTYAQTINLVLEDDGGPAAFVTTHTAVDLANLLELLGEVTAEADHQVVEAGAAA